MTALRCPVCGTESLATVLSSGPPGSRLLRQTCRECERRSVEEDRNAARRVGRALARLLISAGILLGGLALTAEYLGISGEPGFGWRQAIGVELGFLGVVMGVLLRQRLLGVGALFLLVLSLGADVLRVGHSPGLGWRKQAALAAAAALIASGELWQRSLRDRAENESVGSS